MTHASQHGITYLQLPNTSWSARQDKIARLQSHHLTYPCKELIYVKNHVTCAGMLAELPVYPEPNLLLVWVWDGRRGDVGADGAEGVEAFRDGPWLACGFGSRLDITSGKIQGYGIPSHMARCILKFDVGSGLPNDHTKFNYDTEQ